MGTDEFDDLMMARLKRRWAVQQAGSDPGQLAPGVP
jgi:hypothetical protein